MVLGILAIAGKRCADECRNLFRFEGTDRISAWENIKLSRVVVE